MFEDAKIRRNLAEFEKKVENLGDDVLFYPIKTIRDIPHFHQLIRRFRAYHELATAGYSSLDRHNLRREVLDFLKELKSEVKVVKSKKMKLHFEMLIAGAGLLVELMESTA